jgi:hypothetical protein
MVTVGTGGIGYFANGDAIVIHNVTTSGMTLANGPQTVSNVDAINGTFDLTGLDLSAGATPATGAITASPAMPKPSPSAITSVSNAAAAVVSVGTVEIAKYAVGEQVVIANVPGALFNVVNGTHAITAISAAAGTFTIAVDTSSATAPSASGGTAQAPAPAPPVLVWTKICGITSRTVTRASTMQQSEVPDCDDESLPAAIERSVQSQDVSITGTGVWAAQSEPIMMAWWYGGKPKNIRVTNLQMPSGGIETETGPAYLTGLNNVAARGAKVTADITLAFDGLPQLGYAA